MTQVPSQEVTVPILAQHIDAEDGHCWMTVLPNWDPATPLPIRTRHRLSLIHI